MQYTIRELSEKGISKTTVYEALKTRLPFSNEFIKNKRIFTAGDLEIFLYFKDFWAKRTIDKYWAPQAVGEGGTVSNGSTTVSSNPKTVEKQESNDTSTQAIKSLSEKLDTVEKQFKDKEREYQKTIEEKEKLIQVKDNQTQKFAIAKVEAEKEKKEWIEKYEKANTEKEHWMSKFYSMKTYLLVLAVLCILAIAGLVLVITWTVSM